MGDLLEDSRGSKNRDKTRILCFKQIILYWVFCYIDRVQKSQMTLSFCIRTQKDLRFRVQGGH